jgi:CotH kinase protein
VQSNLTSQIKSSWNRIKALFFLALVLLSPLDAQNLESTTLPLIMINTNGQEIPDEPKITADLKIIHHPGTENTPSDAGNVYDGLAGIEIRGSYSASLPQKPYGIETRDEAGENLNISILGMPEENDWILLANYNDKSFMRNTLAFHLFEKMGHYAPRTQLCEVLLNDEYQGIYVFTEKIKRDKNRIDIARLDADDNAGDSLTGGYIIKIDYPDDASWKSDYYNPNYYGSSVYFVPDYPKAENFTSEQYNYIKNWIANFEDVIWGNQFSDPVTGYRKFIDVPSFIDYFLISELSRNMDGYKKSRRLYKDKDSKDPRLYAGPVWDFDWAFKDQGYDMLDGEGWQYNYEGASDVKPPGWYIRLMEDPWFTSQLKRRFTELQQSIFSYQYINDYIDSVALLVNEAQFRHYEKWPILGRNVGTPEIGTQPMTYQGEVNKFKEWLMDRLVWLHMNMPGDGSHVETKKTEIQQLNLTLYPNPVSDYLVIESTKPFSTIRIYDIQGRLQYSEDCQWATFRRLSMADYKGLFILEVQGLNGQVSRERIICNR